MRSWWRDSFVVFCRITLLLFEHTQNDLSALLSLEQVAGRWMKGVDRLFAAGQSIMCCQHDKNYAYFCCFSPRSRVLRYRMILSRRVWQEEKDSFRYVLEGYGIHTEVNYYVRTVARNLFIGVAVAKRAKKHQQL